MELRQQELLAQHGLIDMYGKLGFDNEGKRIKDFARYFEFFGGNELQNFLNKIL